MEYIGTITRPFVNILRQTHKISSRIMYVGVVEELVVFPNMKGESMYKSRGNQ